MAISKKAVKTKVIKQRSYLNKDFDSFRADLLSYARQFFNDKIEDFGEGSVGGLFIDLAAYIGDVLAFYLDHQFAELDINKAVEFDNIERLIRDSGVDIIGASPAVVDVSFYVEVPVISDSNNNFIPQETALPIIGSQTLMVSDDGVSFELIDDIDFKEKDEDGNLIANNGTPPVGDVSSTGQPETFILSRTVMCVSGFRAKETFNVPDISQPFRTMTLSNANISDIISVIDSAGNIYYEVESLAQDTLFKAVLNTGYDEIEVPSSLRIIPIPYRYIKSVALGNRITTIQFGSGDGETLDDDIVPDPAELALPMYGKSTFKRFTLDPNNLLRSRTLGIAPRNTTVTVDYRYGGGLNNNVGSKSINTISELNIRFPGGIPVSLQTTVRNSLDVTNLFPASGGEDAPSLDVLRAESFAAHNAQGRIVTKQDLLARIHTLPTTFGRVFRAGMAPNPNNPLAVQVFIISRNKNNKLIISPDMLKDNLSTYLNEFRLISSGYDILDASVINLGIEFSIVVDPSANKAVVLQNVNVALIQHFRIENYHIHQPILISEILNLIFGVSGVISVLELEFFNKTNNIKNKLYSSYEFNVELYTRRGLIIPPTGGIFEIRYPTVDIIGSAE